MRLLGLSIMRNDLRDFPRRHPPRLAGNDPAKTMVGLRGGLDRGSARRHRDGMALIVDGHEVSRLVLHWALTRVGWTALPVDGASRLDAILEREPVSLVILGFGAEEQEDLCAIGRLAALDPAARPGILVVAAVTHPGVGERALDAGADAFSPRPIDVLEILATADRLTRSRRVALGHLRLAPGPSDRRPSRSHGLPASR